MNLLFLKHQWYKLKRSPAFAKELTINIILWIIAIFVLIFLLSFALLLPSILSESLGITDIVGLVNKYLIYYFIAELILRYLMQKVPVLDIEPYLLLPVRKRQIASHLLTISSFSFYNIISLVLTFPIALQEIYPTYGLAGTVSWLGMIFLFSLSAHFFNIIFKKKYEHLPWVWGIIVVAFAIVLLIDQYTNIQLLTPLADMFSLFITTPILVLMPLMICCTLGIFAYRTLVVHFYLEDLSDTSSASYYYGDKLAILDNGKLSRALILQELKLIFRHKRTRSLSIISLLLLGYGYVIFGQEKYADLPSFYLLMAVLMSGIFAMNYAQFQWSWFTNQMDFFFTRPISLKEWVIARYNLLATTTVVSTLLALPYSYFGWKIALVLLASGIYNIGINIPLMMRMAMWGAKPIDLGKSQIMNYEGTGAAQWLMAIPLMLGAYIFYIPVYYTLGYIAAIGTIALVGILGIVFRNLLIGLVVSKLHRLKYKLIKDLVI